MLLWSLLLSKRSKEKKGNTQVLGFFFFKVQFIIIYIHKSYQHGSLINLPLKIAEATEIMIWNF